MHTSSPCIIYIEIQELQIGNVCITRKVAVEGIKLKIQFQVHPFHHLNAHKACNTSLYLLQEADMK